MARLHKSVAIDAPPDDVWAVLGDLAATKEWLPDTVDSHMDGDTRVCTTADGAGIREAISDYSAERRTYRYRHLEVPLPIANSVGSFAVDPRDGNGSVVVLEAEFDALDADLEPELERMFGGALDEALESLRRRVETGASWNA